MPSNLSNHYDLILTLSPETVFEISRESYRLLELGENVKGRTLRRFVSRVCSKGFISQVFAYEGGFSADQLNAIEAYARDVAAKSICFIPADVAVHSSTFQEPSFGMVQNVFTVHADVGTASVRELAAIVRAIAVLSDTMHEYRADINKAALRRFPDYRYRNKPSTLSEAPWCVSGSDIRGGSGVLEWCYDREDAHERFVEMQQHGRFRDLSYAAFGFDLNPAAVE